jgi:hypothetical protein
VKFLRLNEKEDHSEVSFGPPEFRIRTFILPDFGTEEVLESCHQGFEKLLSGFEKLISVSQTLKATFQKPLEPFQPPLAASQNSAGEFSKGQTNGTGKDKYIQQTPSPTTPTPTTTTLTTTTYLGVSVDVHVTHLHVRVC